MKPLYQIAVDKFLENWEHKKDVVGVVICGSYVTGNPSKHSDIDLQILLDKNIKWRERGNKIVDGFLIEYFANPLPQVLKYLEDDYTKNRKIVIHMFTTGKILFDKTGDLSLIIKKAKQWDKKKFKKPDKSSIGLNKYMLWDMVDNLEEVYESKSEDFYFVYYNCLSTLFEVYSKFLGFHTMHTNKLKRFLTNEKDKKKYNLPTFPDKEFVKIYIKALKLRRKSKLMTQFRNLVKYVHKKMGGFEIDGWKVKSPVEVKK